MRGPARKLAQIVDLAVPRQVWDVGRAQDARGGSDFHFSVPVEARALAQPPHASAHATPPAYNRQKAHNSKRCTPPACCWITTHLLGFFPCDLSPGGWGGSTQPDVLLSDVVAVTAGLAGHKLAVLRNVATENAGNLRTCAQVGHSLCSWSGSRAGCDGAGSQMSALLVKSCGRRVGLLLGHWQ